jgi:EAL domain-containing protein (putative c-di-GMP-specific phosphodiesterase class I)
VETAEQLRALSLLHCDEYQGFLFGEPVAAETFEAKYLAPRVVPLKNLTD